MSEGGVDPAGWATPGDQGSSFGPGQLHYGGVASGGNSVGGLGDAFTRTTGLNARDPSTWQQQIDFSLDQAAQGGWGPWHGAARVGVSQWQGIRGNAANSGASNRPFPTPSAPVAPPARGGQVAAQGSSPKSLSEGVAPALHHFTYVDGGQEVLKIIRADGGQEFHVTGKKSPHPNGTITDPGNLPVGQPLPPDVQAQMPAWERQELQPPAEATAAPPDGGGVGSGQDEGAPPDPQSAFVEPDLPPGFVQPGPAANPVAPQSAFVEQPGPQTPASLPVAPQSSAVELPTPQPSPPPLQASDNLTPPNLTPQAVLGGYQKAGATPPPQVLAGASAQYAQTAPAQSPPAGQGQIQATNIYGQPITQPDVANPNMADPIGTQWNASVAEAQGLLPTQATNIPGVTGAAAIALDPANAENVVGAAGLAARGARAIPGVVRAASDLVPQALMGGAVVQRAGQQALRNAPGALANAAQATPGAAANLARTVGGAARALPGNLANAAQKVGEEGSLALRAAQQTTLAEKQLAQVSPAFAARAAVGATVGGAETALQVDPNDPNRTADILAGAAAGMGGMYVTLAAGPSALRAARSLLAPVMNKPAPVQQAIVRWVAGLNGADEAGHLWGLRAENALGPSGKSANVLDSAKNFEAGKDFEGNAMPPPGQPLTSRQQFLSDLEYFFNQTGDEGRAEKYISGDVRNQAFPGQRYFPHVHEEYQNAAAAKGRSMGLNPKGFYSNERTFKTLGDAQAAGLHPQNSVSEPVALYARNVLRSRENNRFVNALDAFPDEVRQGDGNAQAKGLVPKDWVWGGNADRFPSLAHNQHFNQRWFEPGMAQIIQNNLDKPSQGITRGIFGVYNQFRASLLGQGAFHLISEEGQAFGVGGPYKGQEMLRQSIWNMLGPNYQKFQLDNIDLFQRAADANVTGLTGGRPADWGLGMTSQLGQRATAAIVPGAIGGAYGYSQAKAQGQDDPTAFGDALKFAVGTGLAASTIGMAFQHAVFNKAIPTLKVMSFGLLDNGKRDPLAIGSFINRTYGGNSMKAIGRAPWVQSLMRGLLLAADWQEGWVRQVGNAFLPGASGDLSRRYWGQMLLTSAVTLEGLNLMTGGHPTSDNEDGHKLDLEVTNLLKLTGQSKRDPSTGQEQRVYWDILGPLRPYAYAAIAGGEAVAGKYGQGMQGWLPQNQNGPAGVLGSLVSGRVSPLLSTYSQLKSGKDYYDNPIVQPGTDPLHALAQQVTTAMGGFEPVPVQQYASEQRRYGAPVSLVASATGRYLSATTPASVAYSQNDQQIQKLGGDAQEVTKAAQTRTLFKDEAQSSIAQMYAGGGVVSGKPAMTHQQIDAQEQKYRDQTPDLPDLYSALSGAPISPELKTYLGSAVVGASGSDLPADLLPDQKAQITALAADYQYPQPQSQFDSLNQTEQDKLRRTKLQDTAASLGIDPETLLDAIKAQQWGLPVPDAGVTSAEIESWTSSYLNAGKDSSTAQERAFARNQALAQIQAQHPNLTTDQIKARINLRITPYSPQISEPQQSHEKALDLLLNSEGLPKYVKPDGTPDGGPAQWASYDAKIKEGAHPVGIRTVYSPEAQKLKDERDLATAQRMASITQSDSYTDYERWFGVGKTMTEAQWQSYMKDPTQRWKDSPDPQEAMRRENILAEYSKRTPAQRVAFSSPSDKVPMWLPTTIKGKPGMGWVLVNYKTAYTDLVGRRGLQQPDWQKRYDAAAADSGLAATGDPADATP